MLARSLITFSCVVLLVAACGSDKEVDAEKTTEQAADAPMLARPEAESLMQANAPDLGEAVTEIRLVDDAIGNGAVAEQGDVLSVHYHGWIYNPDSADHKGQLFDRSKVRGPFRFRLGAGRVIRGWDHGMLGMRKGGKRTLYVPAELGYADRGVPGLIPPNSALMFEVELLDVKKQPTRSTTPSTSAEG